MENSYLIKVLKYNDSLHYSWESELVENNEDYLLFKALLPRRLNHFTRKTILEYNNASLEFISKKNWFTINVDISIAEKEEYYCNICTIPTIIDQTIQIIDLDVDMIIDKQGRHQFIDIDEFEDNRLKMNYSDEIVTFVKEEMDGLANRYAKKKFPFDGFFDKYIKDIKKDLVSRR